MKTALVLVLNNFTHDSRVLRQVEALGKRGYRVCVFALHDGCLLIQEQTTGYLVRRFKLATRSWQKNKLVQVIKYAECIVRMTCAGVGLSPRLVQANDLDTLPIGFMVAKLARAKLIYDSHELWSDPAGKANLPSWLFRIAIGL